MDSAHQHRHLLTRSIPRARNIGSHFSVAVSAANSEIVTKMTSIQSTSDEGKAISFQANKVFASSRFLIAQRVLIVPLQAFFADVMLVERTSNSRST